MTLLLSVEHFAAQNEQRVSVKALNIGFDGGWHFSDDPFTQRCKVGSDITAAERDRRVRNLFNAQPDCRYPAACGAQIEDKLIDLIDRSPTPIHLLIRHRHHAASRN
jgi:hypothetical protein